jgi:hypothetical protein
MSKDFQTLLVVGGIAAVAYYLYRQQVPAGSAATPQEEAQSAASTLDANLAAALGTQ